VISWSRDRSVPSHWSTREKAITQEPLRMKYQLTALAVLAWAFQSASVQALPNEQAARLQQTIRSTPAVELPAVAAKSISQARAADQEQVTQVIINSIAAAHPTSLPTVVASIAATTPAQAPIAAALAAKASPKQANGIVHAASLAAPGHANQITQAVRDTGVPLDLPPGMEHRPPVTPGNEHGNRPVIPPGLGKNEYGSP